MNNYLLISNDRIAGVSEYDLELRGFEYVHCNSLGNLPKTRLQKFWSQVTCSRLNKPRTSAPFRSLLEDHFDKLTPHITEGAIMSREPTVYLIDCKEMQCVKAHSSASELANWAENNLPKLNDYYIMDLADHLAVFSLSELSKMYANLAPPGQKFRTKDLAIESVYELITAGIIPKLTNEEVANMPKVDRVDVVETPDAVETFDGTDKQVTAEASEEKPKAKRVTRDPAQLDRLETFLKEKGEPGASIEEMCKFLDVSVSRVRSLLGALRPRGLNVQNCGRNQFHIGPGEYVPRTPKKKEEAQATSGEESK